MCVCVCVYMCRGRLSSSQNTQRIKQYYSSLRPPHLALHVLQVNKSWGLRRMLAQYLFELRWYSEDSRMTCWSLGVSASQSLRAWSIPPERMRVPERLKSCAMEINTTRRRGKERDGEGTVVTPVTKICPVRCEAMQLYLHNHSNTHGAMGGSWYF